jgi:site-specific DNA-methyltransferase (adenine-specific)
MFNTYNPDVLTCLANLSNDEVFTPPNIANQMLDLLPQEIFTDPNATFLDPACKSGVFLREIAKRLMAGLEKEFPDRQKRINHIFTKQLYGIAITDMTALLTRRSLYCSKKANGKYSICEGFDTPDGNIMFGRVIHEWEGAQCKYCGANIHTYDRDESLETHAYKFIHTNSPEEIFKMKFDVIVGNPPYQLGSDGGTRDIPIYNKFVDQAKKLNPRFLTMIIPSRWMASGLGLSEFRRTMLEDRRIQKLVDYPMANEIFPGVNIEGGVCYFLWERDTEGSCDVTTIRGDEVEGPVNRNLGEYDVFVRDSRAIEILHKVQRKKEPSIIEILSVDKEFGWTSNFDGFHDKKKSGDVPIYYIRKMKRSVGWIERSAIKKSENLIDTWKAMVPQAHGSGKSIPHSVLGRPFVAPNPSVCTQTYLFFYLDSKRAAESVESYLRTRFLRFLVSLRKITQHATRSTYTWVPQQTWDRTWTDNELYKKYNLTKDDIAFIESRIRPMDSGEEADG